MIEKKENSSIASGKGSDFCSAFQDNTDFEIKVVRKKKFLSTFLQHTNGILRTAATDIKPWSRA